MTDEKIALIIGVILLLSMIISGVVIAAIILSNKDRSKEIARDKKKRSLQRKKKQQVKKNPEPKKVDFTPIKRTLYQMCDSNADCNVNEQCTPSRMYYIKDYDVDDMESDDMVGKRLVPFVVSTLEEKRWSVVDVVDFNDNLIIATNTKNIVVVNDDSGVRTIETNVLPKELAIYQGSLLAICNDSVYDMPFSTFYHPKWVFGLNEEFSNDGPVKSIEASRDRSVLSIGANSTRTFVNGKLESTKNYTPQVLGNEPGQYAEVADDDTLTIHPNDVTLSRGSTGVFTEENRFFKLSGVNANWIQRLRLVSNQPLAISQPVCMHVGMPPMDINIV